jgi:hypothetical protein
MRTRYDTIEGTQLPVNEQDYDYYEGTWADDEEKYD